MIETASLRFHKVKHCGLYKQLGRKAEFGSFKEIVENVKNWSSHSNRLVHNTCTYEVSADADMDFLETYLVSAKHESSTGDYVFATWNRTHNSGDSVYGLDPSTAVDSVSKGALHKGNLPAKSIPGYASYFWLIPSSNTIATITFGVPRTGMKPFAYWLESFIRAESRYVRFDKEDKFLGYAAGTSAPNPDLHPRFERSLHRNLPKRDIIIKYRSHITGVVRRINLTRTKAAHLTVLEKLGSLMGVSSQTSNQIDVPLTYELKYTPSEADLDAIIKAYEGDSSTSNWEDVGFKFPASNAFGANQIEWLSKSYAKGQASIDVAWVVPGQLLDMQVLLNTLTKRRSELVALFAS
ncbi:hypothetical protein [Limnobacter alexandrii]|jgi:hypothetical protein|uniref:hypothetical protein n=1 Tax=Limnobacter alexandrii TaxID=2570352 RepID=UPI001107E788|nr:hypothetical protein [Limnobacter alexandrii]